MSTNRLLQPLNVGRTRFYAPTDFNLDHPGDSARFARIERAQIAYFDATREDHGLAFENIVHKAMVQSNAFDWLNEPGQSPPSGSQLSGVAITGSGKLDHWLLHKGTSIPVAVEDKNLRDWFYPDRAEVRELLGKAVTYRMLPVLVARRVHFTTRRFFSRIGAVAYQTYFSYFPSEYADRLSDVRHKDGLGFADLRFTDDPPPHLISLFSTLLPPRLQHDFDLFKSRFDLIRDYVNQEIDYAAVLVELGITEPEDDVP